MTNHINLTDLEKVVLKGTMPFWNYGNEFEKEDNVVIFNATDLSNTTGLGINTCKGVMSSLHKKGLFCDMECGYDAENDYESGLTDTGIDTVLYLK
jgi:hypothetical protein